MRLDSINQRVTLARAFKELPKRTAALVLAGGRGARLQGLTKTRAKPSVHFGGKFRIIDFALSNCMNSGIRRIGILTQYHSHSLVQHIQRGWSFLNEEMNEFVDLLPAQQRNDSDHWYSGTADAIYQNVDIIKLYNVEYIIVLAGDHIYKMDYSQMLWDHVKKGAKCSVACVSVPLSEASQFGVMQIDDTEKIIKFIEKPRNPPAMPTDPDNALVSMGVYVFNSDYLYHLLQEDSKSEYSKHDFGKDIIPKAVRDGTAWAHPFSLSCIMPNSDSIPYWRDVGTLDSYWQANLDLVSVIPELDMYDEQWPIRTYMEPLPPARFVQDKMGNHGVIVNSLIGAGCIVYGSVIDNSVLFSGVHVNPNCSLDSAVLLPDVIVGSYSRLRHCIIDRACHIPDGMVVGENPEEDKKRFSCSRKGVVLVTREMLDKLNNN